MKSDGVKYVFIKATQGTTFVDPKYRINSDQVRSQGIVQGAYHFYHPDQGAVVQAKEFLNNTNI